MKVSCLMGTYGRYGVACEALACFLQQTALSDATLLIYNQHPEPLFFDHPRVRVVNETVPSVGLRHIRARMHELSNPDADFIHWWDDDDLYLPWHLSDGLTHIGENIAWKPATSWFCDEKGAFRRLSNRFEGSWLFRADYLRSAPIDTHPEYADHPVIYQISESDALAMTELGNFASYIYRWQQTIVHLSALGTGDSAANVETWRRRSADVRADGVLVPAPIEIRWREFLDGVRSQVTEHEHAELARRLNLSVADDDRGGADG
jgi:hypothetical protein